MRLVLASNNAKKLSELRALLAGVEVELVAQGDLGIPEADEPFHTFIENALVKARQAAQACGGAAIADDSGVCVDALGGEPGVVSANYAAIETREPDREARRRIQDAANNARLLQRLAGATDRRAHFVSTLVAVRHAQDPQPLVAVGRWPGEILSAPRGTLGFGYDPLMLIPELGCTVAEMDAAQKNAHSHRARACAQMVLQLRDVWQL
jgi:XTP/dITP diphosphohydrolase